MIVKILSSASSDFHGVKYNEKKRKSGAGELMLMQNFPDGIDEKSKQEEVRNYFKAISCYYFYQVSKSFQRRADRDWKTFYERNGI